MYNGEDQNNPSHRAKNKTKTKSPLSALASLQLLHRVSMFAEAHFKSVYFRTFQGKKLPCLDSSGPAQGISSSGSALKAADFVH